MSTTTQNGSPGKVQNPLVVKAMTKGTYISAAILALLFYYFTSKMGVSNFFGTLMKTGFDLLLNTALYIMAVAVMAAAVASLMSEFGIISMINRVLSPLMRPLYRLPGAAALGVVSTFFSDNMAITALMKDPEYAKYFNLRQRAVLTNLGTTFGMGLIVSTFMLGASDHPDTVKAVVIGIACASVASIISVRLMDIFSRKYYGPAGDELLPFEGAGEALDIFKFRMIREGNAAQRALGSLLDGGTKGVELGLSIIPGLLVVCTPLMMIVLGTPEGGFTGKAYEGLGLVPVLAGKIDFILNPLFGFSSPEAVAFPITAAGSVGAAIGVVPGMLAKGLIGPNDIAVFTAIGITYSGFLSTHVAMMDALNARPLVGKAILTHAFAGICAGVLAHWLFVFI